MVASDPSFRTAEPGCFNVIWLRCCSHPGRIRIAGRGRFNAIRLGASHSIRGRSGSCPPSILVFRPRVTLPGRPSQGFFPFTFSSNKIIIRRRRRWQFLPPKRFDSVAPFCIGRVILANVGSRLDVAALHRTAPLLPLPSFFALLLHRLSSGTHFIDAHASTNHLIHGSSLVSFQHLIFLPRFLRIRPVVGWIG